MESYWKDIWKDYDNKRETAKLDLEQRRKKVFSEFEDIRKIEDKIQHMGFQYSLQLINEPEEKSCGLQSSFEAQLNQLIEQKKQLLAEYGLGRDYLDLKYNCRLCEDSGYIGINGQGAVMCSCLKQLLIHKMYEYSNINSDGQIGLEFFDANLYSDTLDNGKSNKKISPRRNALRIKDKCLDFINGFEDPSTKNMFFCGSIGVGKTFMSKSIALEILKKGFTVLYIPAPSLFEIIYSAKYDNKDSFAYRNILHVDLLIIDDLGTETPSAAKYAELLTILNHRAVSASKRISKTIISSNMNVKELYESYSERVASRIIGDFDILSFIGDDIRIIKRLSDKDGDV